MRCDSARRELAAYLDGELAAAERGAVEEHLAGCAACRDELGALRDADAMLAELDAPAGPLAGFEERLAARLAAEPGAGRMHAGAPARRRAWGWVSGVAAAALLAVALAPFAASWLAPDRDGDATIARHGEGGASAVDELDALLLDADLEQAIIAQLDVLLEDPELAMSLDLLEILELLDDPLLNGNDGERG